MLNRIIQIAVVVGMFVVAFQVFAGKRFGDLKWDHRIEIQYGEVFYTDQMSSAEMNRLTECLNDLYGEQTNEKSFHVERLDDQNILFRMVVNEEAQAGKLNLPFEALEIVLQQDVFPDDNVQVLLCDTSFQTCQTIDSAPAPASK